MSTVDYRKVKKVEKDGVIFDSKKEANYYLNVLKPLVAKKEITDIGFHPDFILQERFTKNGKKYRPIIYKADFKVTWANGVIEIIEVKGFETRLYKIKRKMFEYKYRDLTLKVVK